MDYLDYEGLKRYHDLSKKYWNDSIDEIKEEVGMLTHKYVDLGLPSGTLWATMNVGATSETDYGNYYQYGKGAAQYAATSGDSNYSGTEEPLDSSVDTAVQVWGGSWHMPTRAQMQELTENTTYQWVTNYKGSGINGGTFTATNGTVLFFPAAGYWGSGSQYNVGKYGNYWGSSPNGSSNAYNLYFGNGPKGVSNNGRKYGYSVRPVHDPFPVSPAKVKDALGINSSTGSATKYLNEQGNFVFENAYKTSIVVDDLIGSSISTNTKNALIGLRDDSNSNKRLILLKSNSSTNELTYIPAYIRSYGSEFNMWFNYEDKFYHIQASPDNSQWVVITLSKQDEITATGLLKGLGNGSVSAAVAGTDYQAPLTFNTAPSSSNKVATMSDVMIQKDVTNEGNNLNIDFLITPGSYRLGASHAGTFPTGLSANYAQMLVLFGGGDTYAQLYFPYSTSDVYLRTGAGYVSTGINWNSWVKLSSSSDLSSYLPLSGGTITGVTEVTADFSTYSNFKLKSVGSGTYDIGCILKDSNGLHIESPRASDSASASPLGVHIEARGGQYSFVKAAEYRQTYTHPTAATSYTISPNVEYFLDTIAANTTFTLGNPESSVVNEYKFQFDMGSTAYSITMPSSIIWASEPTFEADYHYEVSIKYDPIRNKYYGLCTAFFNITLADRLTSTGSIGTNTPYVIAGTYSDGANGTITNPIIQRSVNNLKMCGSNSSYTIAYYDVKTGTVKTKTYTSSNYSNVYSTILNQIKGGINDKFSTNYSMNATPANVPSSVTYYIEL